MCVCGGGGGAGQADSKGEGGGVAFLRSDVYYLQSLYHRKKNLPCKMAVLFVLKSACQRS